MPRGDEVALGTVLMSRDEFVEWLRYRVNKRIPAAIVRFGDSEAQLLAADATQTQSMTVAIDALERETGLSFSPEDALEIGALVALAYDNADVLGIRFRDGAHAGHKMRMRKLIAHYAARVAAGRPPVPLAHNLLGHQIVDALPALLAGRRVSAISCRDLKPVLEGEWGLDDVAVYQVPSQHLVRDVDGAYEAVMHDVPIWPDAHARIRRELTVRERGEVFLVGAGVFGKDLCISIRDKGGIALDMGSALDRIVGKITRGLKRRLLDLYALGMSMDEIASHGQRLYGTRVDAERISQVVDATLSEAGRPRRST
ncbi:MAG TPA: hypothetical protein VF085_09880 [Solirubrobacterales bacterium]